MSSSQYLVIVSPSDDVFEDIADNRSSLARGDIRSAADYSEINVDAENSSRTNPTRRLTHSGLSRINHLLNRTFLSADAEGAALSTEPNLARIVTCPPSDQSSEAPAMVETVDESQNPAPDEKTRWRVFPRGWQMSVCAGRTVKVGEHALRALLIDVLPWVAGCYVIFYAFRNGGLGLGFTVFLLLVSAHGVLKWWTARGDDKAEPDETVQSQQEPSTSTACTNSHYHHHHSNPHHHHHHNHRHGSDSDTEDYTTSDDSDLDDIFEKPRVVVDEPPPSYDAASNPTPQDLCLSLEVHLTPREPRVEVDLSDLDGHHFSNKFLLANFVDNRKSSARSTSSYVSTELDDEFLPSYSEAVKKTKKRKSRRNSRCKGSDNCLYDAIVNQSNSPESNTSKSSDVRLTITSTKDIVPTDIVVSSLDDDPISRISSSSHSSLDIVVSSLDDDPISRISSSSHSSLDSIPCGYVSGSPPYSHRLFTTDCNSLLMTDAVFTYNSDETAS